MKYEKDSLGTRMKEYEGVFNQKLPKRVPVIIRIDGKAFHTYTKGMKRPYDEVLSKAMKNTMKKLCEEIIGAKIGYTQSDEITIVLSNNDKINTEAWFDNKVQKIVSVASSIATFEFNRIMYPLTNKIAYFDARVFIVPDITEMCNNLYWRQLDATRNSIQMLAQSEFSHKELQGLNTKKLQDKLFSEKGINWNDLEVWKKRGSCSIKDLDGKWEIDENIPIFKDDWNYLIDKINSKELN